MPAHPKTMGHTLDPAAASAYESEPLRFEAIAVQGAQRNLLLGSKYQTNGSRLLASSSRHGWRPGLAAELRRHEDLHCPPFFQPVNEVAIAVRGSALVQRRGTGPEQKFCSSAGLACLCPRGVDVSYLHIAEGSLDMLHVYMPPSLFGLLDIDDDCVRDVGLRYMAGVQDDLIAQVGQAIAAELLSEPATRAGSLKAESLGVALAAHLAERYSRPGEARRALAKADEHTRGGVDGRRLRRVVDFVHAHVDTDISLDAMAREACLSRFHFVRAFRRSTGQTPQAFVAAVRVARAKQMLRESPATIENVALALNFSSSSNFIRAFKRSVGVTPSAYRSAR